MILRRHYFKRTTYINPRYPEGAHQVSFASFRGTMQKARSIPALPQNPEEFGMMLNQTVLYSNTLDSSVAARQIFFRGILNEGGPTGVTILVFASDKMLGDILQHSQNLYIDGTFKVVPNMFHQLVTIHGEAFNYVCTSNYLTK